jgi:hypothetical protein
MSKVLNGQSTDGQYLLNLGGRLAWARPTCNLQYLTKVIKPATSHATTTGPNATGLRWALIAVIGTFLASWMMVTYPSHWFWIATPMSALLALAALKGHHPIGKRTKAIIPVGNKLPLIIQIIPIWQRLIEHARRHSETSSEDMLHTFKSLSTRLDSITPTAPASSEKNALMVEQEIEQVLVGFQAQDRLSQMLDNVTQDMSKMSTWLASDGDMDEKQAQEWLERLYASYTMEEQRSQHMGGAVTQRESAVEFF